MIVSGTTAIETTADDAVKLLDYGNTRGWYNLTIDNSRCAVEGWWSVDGGTTWARLGASSVVNEPGIYVSGNVMVKRIASGSNLTGLWAWMTRRKR